MGYDLFMMAMNKIDTGMQGGGRDDAGGTKAKLCRGFDGQVT